MPHRIPLTTVPFVMAALPKELRDFVDKNGSTLQNMALLAYLRKGDRCKPFLEAITAAQVTNK